MVTVDVTNFSFRPACHKIFSQFPLERRAWKFLFSQRGCEGGCVQTSCPVMRGCEGGCVQTSCDSDINIRGKSFLRWNRCRETESGRCSSTSTTQTPSFFARLKHALPCGSDGRGQGIRWAGTDGRGQSYVLYDRTPRSWPPVRSVRRCAVCKSLFPLHSGMVLQPRMSTNALAGSQENLHCGC